jgi:hypothetical protein
MAASVDSEGVVCGSGMGSVVGVEEELPSSGSTSILSTTSFNFSWASEEAIDMTDPVEELRHLPYVLSLWALVIVQPIWTASLGSLRMRSLVRSTLWALCSAFSSALKLAKS